MVDHGIFISGPEVVAFEAKLAAATTEAVALVGGTPVCVDVRAADFNIDVGQLEAGLRGAKDKGLKPRALIAVDLSGLVLRRQPPAADRCRPELRRRLARPQGRHLENELDRIIEEFLRLARP